MLWRWRSHSSFINTKLIENTEKKEPAWNMTTLVIKLKWKYYKKTGEL